MAARRRPGTSIAVLAIALVIVLLTLVAGGAAQDGFPFRDFPNPVPYAPLAERPRTFQRDVQHQAFQQQYSSFQSSPFQQHSPFQNKFQSPLRQPFQVDPGAYQLEQKHPYTRNASSFAAFQARPFQTPPPQAVQRPEDAPGAFFPDPHFEHLFQRELNHQIQLEHQRLQEQQQQHQQQQQQHQNVPSYQIQQSVQVERPQLQELQELHSLLEQQLEMHEVRHNERLRPQLAPVTQGAPPHSLLEQQQQRQQQEMLQEMIRQHQQQQHNLVDSHELFMSQKIKPQTPPPPPPRRPSPPQPPPPKQRQTKKPSTTTTTTTTTTPREPLEVIDLSQFLPFLGQQQQDQLRQQINLAQQVQLQQQKQQTQPGKGKPQPQESVREQQRLRQQQRQQETLRQQEERRLQEERQRERQRQLRQQAQQQQQRQQEQEKRQNKAQQQQPTGGAGRQQRQQPVNNKINNNNTGNRTTAEKPVTSVRDLFNTSSCIEPPLTCPHPRIHFYLYTRTTQAEGQKVDVTKPESLINTQFNPKHPIKLLIHGFQGGRQFSPSIDLRKAYFIRGDYNIFVVDYNSLVRLPCLSQIQWSPSFLALCVSQLLTYVDNTTASVTGSRVPPDRFHLIGYSIGAHIAGLVANYIDRDQGKLGRITGLDPTIIFYQGANRSQDLDPSDAHFIDVIHTGAGILGQRGPNGHVDYYVNGGTTQPGCQSDSLIKTLSCDHTKVSPYYVESIVTPVGFWALPCPNLFMYLLGFCQPKDEDYIIMGEDAPHTARGIYYLSTNGNKPYAKGFPGKKMPIKFPKWRPN